MLPSTPRFMSALGVMHTLFGARWHCPRPATRGAHPDLSSCPGRHSTFPDSDDIQIYPKQSNISPEWCCDELQCSMTATNICCKHCDHRECGLLSWIQKACNKLEIQNRGREHVLDHSQAFRSFAVA